MTVKRKRITLFCLILSALFFSACAVSPAGLADTVAWYRENEDWWREAKAEVEAKYAKTGQ